MAVTLVRNFIMLLFLLDFDSIIKSLTMFYLHAEISNDIRVTVIRVTFSF